MIYAVDVIGDCPFGWNAELFSSSDKAYDYKAEMMSDRDAHNRFSYRNAVESELTTLSFEEWIAEGSGYNYRYIVVEFDSLKEAELCYDGRVYKNL